VGTLLKVSQVAVLTNRVQKVECTSIATHLRIDLCL
jgi:hypothetical protein